jgi:hypothetical protein
MYVVAISNKTQKKEDINKQSDIYADSKFANELEETEELITYEIYDENQNLIATVDKGGTITFTEEYLETLKNINKNYYNMIDIEGNTFEMPELKEKDMEISKEELEEYMKEQDGKEKEVNWDKEEKETSEVLKIEEKNLRTLAKINPHKLLTANETLGQVIPEANKYDEIEIACEEGNNQNDGRFTMVGVKANGEKEVISSVEQVEGINTGRTVTAINRDGTEVEKQEVKGFFSIADRPEDGISITIGQYNMPEVQYVQNMNDRENRQTIPIEVQNRYNEYVYKRVREEANRTNGLGTTEKDKEIERRTEMVNENNGEIDPQTIDGTDADLIEIKRKIKDYALEQYEDCTPAQLNELIRNELEKNKGTLSDDEFEKTVSEIRINVEDEARAFSKRVL